MGMRKGKRLLNPSRVALLAGGLLGFSGIGGLGSSTAHAAGAGADSVTFNIVLKSIGGVGIDTLDPGTVYTDAMATVGAAPYTFNLTSTVASAGSGNGIQDATGTFTQSGGLSGQIKPAGGLAVLSGGGGTQGTAVGINPFTASGTTAWANPLPDITNVSVAIRGDSSLIDPGNLTPGTWVGPIGQFSVLPGTLTAGASDTVNYVPATGATSFWGAVGGTYESGTGVAVSTGTAGRVFVPSASGVVTLNNNTAVNGNASLTNGLNIAAGQSLAVLGGTVNIDGAQSHGPGANLKVFGGTVNLRSDPGPVNANLNVIVNGGNLNIGQAAVGAGGTYSMNTLTVSGTSTVSVPDNVTNAGRKVIFTNDINVTGPNALVDLAGNAMVVNYTDETTTVRKIIGYVRSGAYSPGSFGSGSPDFGGTSGITSSAAANEYNNADGETALGYLDNGSGNFDPKTTFLGATSTVPASRCSCDTPTPAMRTWMGP